MTDSFLTFQTFTDVEIAKEFAERLKQSGIEYVLENNQKFLIPGFVGDSGEPDISIKLKPDDFLKASNELESFYRKTLDSVDKDYYLFDFADGELMEIITKPDEWGPLDYQLAQKILSDRGKEVKPEITHLLKSQRFNELAKPESISRYTIYLGYFSAIIGGVVGIFIGWCLAYLKKTLPNGSRIYAYRESERNHGVRILLLSLASLIIWIVVRWQLTREG